MPMNRMENPIKVYEPRRASLLAFLGVAAGVVLIIFRNVGWNILEPPVFILVGVLSVSGGLYIGVIGGRQWVYLYEDHLEVCGAIGNFLQRRLGGGVLTSKIAYRDIVALSRRLYESPRAGYLEINQRTEEQKTKRVRVAIPRAKYLDLKAELLKRIPPGCELYSTKGYGKPGPW